MANMNIRNSAQLDGLYGDNQTPITFDSNLVTTTIVDGLTVRKSADRDVWAGGELKYTIEVENNSGNTLSGGILTDTLDNMIEFDAGYGVKINDVATSNYRYQGKLLTISLPDIGDGETKTITFQVIKA